MGCQGSKSLAVSEPRAKQSKASEVVTAATRRGHQKEEFIQPEDNATTYEASAQAGKPITSIPLTAYTDFSGRDLLAKADGAYPVPMTPSGRNPLPKTPQSVSQARPMLYRQPTSGGDYSLPVAPDRAHDRFHMASSDAHALAANSSDTEARRSTPDAYAIAESPRNGYSMPVLAPKKDSYALPTLLAPTAGGYSLPVAKQTVKSPTDTYSMPRVSPAVGGYSLGTATATPAAAEYELPRCEAAYSMPSVSLAAGGYSLGTAVATPTGAEYELPHCEPAPGAYAVSTAAPGMGRQYSLE